MKTPIFLADESGTTSLLQFKQVRLSISISQAFMTTYSKDELLQCIYDTCTEDLPIDWQTTEMIFELSNGASAAKFEYFTNTDSILKEHSPSNFVAPMNAAKILLDQHYLDIKRNDYIRFRIVNNDNMTIHFD